MTIMRKLLTVALALAGMGTAFAWEYDVRRPDAYLRPKWFAADTQPGVWTMNHEDALAKAKAAGKCTLMLFTGSWWCPYCETLESMVLRTDEWKDYVAEQGFYLTMLDFPYRNAVPAGQEWKGDSPRGAGWGFQCWLYDPGYLAEIGLTAEQGLQEIERLYAFQDRMALSTSSKMEISNWNGAGTIEYGRVGYPTLIVIGPDGAELGRLSFPWNREADVTKSEAREYVIQAIERARFGECCICEDPFDGEPSVTAAQVYRGWMTDGEGRIAGTVEVKSGKANAAGACKVSGTVRLGGRKIALKSITVDSAGKGFERFTLESRRGEAKAELSLGAIGLSGTFFDGTAEYTITGGRDMFKAKDALAMDWASSCPTGTWSVVVTAASADIPCGYGVLSVAMKPSGRARVSGTLGDGTAVSAEVQGLAGENGAFCLPVSLAPSGAKSGLGFVMWFRNGKQHCFTNLAPWTSQGASPFSAEVTCSSTMSPGIGSVLSDLELTVAGFDAGLPFGGLELVEDPSFDLVSVSGRAWTGSASVSGFSAKQNARTGLLKGTMTFRGRDARGREKKVRGAFSGIVMGGAGYGTVVFRKIGIWPVKIAVCGSCGE